MYKEKGGIGRRREEGREKGRIKGVGGEMEGGGGGQLSGEF